MPPGTLSEIETRYLPAGGCENTNDSTFSIITFLKSIVRVGTSHSCRQQLAGNIRALIRSAVDSGDYVVPWPVTVRVIWPDGGWGTIRMRRRSSGIVRPAMFAQCLG